MHVAGDGGKPDALAECTLGDVEIQVAAAVADVEMDAPLHRLQHLGVDVAGAIEDAPAAPQGVGYHVAGADQSPGCAGAEKSGRRCAP